MSVTSGWFDNHTHRERLDDLVALSQELLPTPTEELGEIRAEYRDAKLCRDRALLERTDREVERRQAVHGRLASLWMLMCSAQDARDEALSKTTTEDMRAVLHGEFRRRAQGLATTTEEDRGE